MFSFFIFEQNLNKKSSFTHIFKHCEYNATQNIMTFKRTKIKSKAILLIIPNKRQLSGAFRFGTSKIAEPGVGLAAGKVAEVVAVRVGLALEGYIHVGIVAVSIPDQPDKPFDDIPDIKWYEQHFSLLRGVNALVVYDTSVNP